jgi:hypothetical protein
MSVFSAGSVPGAAKAAGFLVALGVVFGAAFGVGHAAGPPRAADEPVEAHQPDHDSPIDADGHGDTHSGQAETAALPGGLMVAQDGYRLRLAADQAGAGGDVPVSFEIEAPDGAPLTSYELQHEKKLHLIAVRRDFRGFQHVHPRMSADGTWSTRLDLSPGPWRIFADFKPQGGEPLTLGADLAVPGPYRPSNDSPESRTYETDGYTVELAGALTAGADARLTATVTKDGRPVTDLQPYLGAYGHLVALREGDLAYLHVHPDGHPGDGTTQAGPTVVFYAAVPSEGGYRLFLDFRHDGVVRTAEFTVATAGTNAAPSQHEAEEESTHGHD